VEPIDRRYGFMAKVDLHAVRDDEHRRLVQNVLNAGMTVSAVQRHDRGGTAALTGGFLARVMGRPLALETTYLVHTDLFKTLLLYRAGSSTLSLRSEEGQLADDRRFRPRLSADQRRNLLLTNGHGGNGASRRPDQGLEARFREELVAALGLTPSSLDSIWQPEIAAEALAAANVLKRQARNRSLLRNELRQAESDHRHALVQEQDAIAAKHGNDQRALVLLGELAAEIDRRLPALMLLPEAGLIERFIASLEEAHGEDRLSDDEHLLLSRLQRLKGDLERMNPRDAAAWKGIARDLEQLTEPAATPIYPAEGNKRH
jgi:hypothetical protein